MDLRVSVHDSNDGDYYFYYYDYRNDDHDHDVESGNKAGVIMMYAVWIMTLS
jgi:hypothetical protein